MSETEIRSRRPSSRHEFAFPHSGCRESTPKSTRGLFLSQCPTSYPRERPLERCRSFAPTSDSALLVQQVDVATGPLLPLLCIIARGWKEKWKILPWQSNVLSLALSRLLLPTSSVCRRTRTLSLREQRNSLRVFIIQEFRGSEGLLVRRRGAY